MKRGVVFDLDGTLIDSAVHCAAIVEAMLADRGVHRSVDLEAARRHVAEGAEALVRGLLGPDLGNAPTDLIEFRARYARLPTPADCLYPGVRKGLRALADGGAAIAICSNKPQELCDKIVDDLDLRAIVSVVVGSRPGSPRKPDPWLLRLAIGKLNLDTSACVYVGDTEIDAATARAAGVAWAPVAYGYGFSAGRGDEGAADFETLGRDVRRGWRVPEAAL